MNRNTFYASTGTFVGRYNNYNYHEIVRMLKLIECDGFEFMYLPSYEGNEDVIANELKTNGVYCPTFHMNKYIGQHLEMGNYDEAKRCFIDNVRFANMLGSHLLVLHLWFGDISKDNMEKIFEFEYDLEHNYTQGLILTIENVPSLNFNPLYLWGELIKRNDDVVFTYDTRFGTFYDENEKIFAPDIWKRVKHVHISSFSGVVDRSKRLIRPILHPGEGVPDFDDLLSKMPPYIGGVTLESPVLSEDGIIDANKLNESIKYLRKLFEKYNG